MVKENKVSRRVVLIIGIVILGMVAALLFCLSIIKTINQRMNESATANLYNTTQVIVDTLEGYFKRDYESLRVVGSIYKNAGSVDTEMLLTFRETMNLDWIGIVDRRGNGVDCFENLYKTTDYSEILEWDLQKEGYSDVYIGRRSGRPQITIWVPIYKDGEYHGTVLGNVILAQYYSANVFNFYEGAGRTYLFSGLNGQWIMKSLGTDGTETRQEDIYSLLNASGNSAEDIETFRKLVEAGEQGAATFNFNGEQSYLCFSPLPNSPDWYVTTVIARDALLKEASQVQMMINMVLIILCITLAIAAFLFAVWRVRHTRSEEENYRETLFANISANLDSAFLIYEKSSRKTAFVSDNIKRILGLNRSWVEEDAGNLFDWCGIPEDDPQRTTFLEGELETPFIREIIVENELGENTRTIRLELIPADMGQELAVLSDVTRDKEIQQSLIEAMEQAKAASNAKNDFLSAMSHDLRTPINGIVGMTTIAVAHLEDKNRVWDCLNKISDSTTHLLTLINEILDMSQIESGKVQMVSEPFNLAELLRNVLSINYPGIQQKNHSVKIRIHRMEHERVIGDSLCLTRIAENLISNAIKYTPSGGTIEIDLREKAPMVQSYGCYELTIKDNGIGMSKEFQKVLFEPFEREEDVRIDRIQGTGLGMSIVKNLVELMMGKIIVQSEKGKGSTFCVMFNLQLDEQKTETKESAEKMSEMMVDEDLDNFLSKSMYKKVKKNNTAEIAAASESLEASPQGKRILLVEDNELNREIAVELLRMMGIEADCAEDGAEAVELFAESPKRTYDMILMDIQMPRMNGYEAARRIRGMETQGGDKIPIVAMTADAFKEDRQSAFIAGMDEHIAKPISVDRLLQVLKRFLI